MILGLILAAGLAPYEIPDVDEPLRRALECKVYADTAKAVHAGDPRMRMVDDKLFQYWSEQSVKLGAKAGMTAEQVEIKSLIIPLETERFGPVMRECLRLTPRRALN